MIELAVEAVCFIALVLMIATILFLVVESDKGEPNV